MGTTVRQSSKLFFLFKRAFEYSSPTFARARLYGSCRALHLASACRSKYIDMSYNTYGPENSSSPPILIMHGVLGSKTNWNSLSKALSFKSNRKVYALDARNHGDSPHTREFSYSLMAGDVMKLLDSQKIDRACLIGHSMGGRTMMRAALSYPERVEKLIVVDISPIQLSTSLVIDRYLDLIGEITLDNSLPLSQGRRLADERLKIHIPEDDIRLFLLANLTKDGGGFKWKPNIAALKENFKNIVEFPLANEVFDKPVLFIGGMKSDYLKKEDEVKISSYFPKAHFSYLPTGHWVHAEQPAAFLELVTEFIIQPT